MKNREEFLGSVYAKRDAELARRKIYKKKLYSGLAAAAACMVLFVGVGSGGLMDLAGGASSEGADGAAMEGLFEATEGAYEGGSRVSAATENESTVNSPEAVPKDAEGTGLLDDGTEDIPDTDGTAGGSDAAGGDACSPGTSGEVADYYMLPAAKIIDADGNVVIRTSGYEQIKKIYDWIDSVEGASNARLDYGKGDELKLGGWTWKVVVETVPMVYEYWYITGEVDLYETGEE